MNHLPCQKNYSLPRSKSQVCCQHRTSASPIPNTLKPHDSTAEWCSAEKRLDLAEFSLPCNTYDEPSLVYTSFCPVLAMTIHNMLVCRLPGLRPCIRCEQSTTVVDIPNHPELYTFETRIYWKLLYPFPTWSGADKICVCSR